MPRKPTTRGKNSKGLRAPSGGWGMTTPSRAFLKLTPWPSSVYEGQDRNGVHVYRATMGGAK